MKLWVEHGMECNQRKDREKKSDNLKLANLSLTTKIHSVSTFTTKCLTSIRKCPTRLIQGCEFTKCEISFDISHWLAKSAQRRKKPRLNRKDLVFLLFFFTPFCQHPLSWGLRSQTAKYWCAHDTHPPEKFF